VPNSAGAIGAAHLALAVNDIHAAIARVEAAGWKAKGSPLPIAGGQGRERWWPMFQAPIISR
jgi:lactoylglutathione lyase